MTDYDSYDGDEPLDEEHTDDRNVTLNRQQIRSLERDAKRARKADEELEQLKRENAFIKAGIDPDTDPKLKYFMSGYDGEITAEAIRTAAEAAGFLTPASTDPDPEQTAHERISQASAGATTKPPTTNQSQIQELEEAARNGGRDAVLATIRKHGHNIV